MSLFLRHISDALVASRHASPEALLGASHYQSCAQIPTGRMARRFGWLDGEQVFVVLNEQTERNARFGDLAIELGFMNKDTLMSLLAKQRAQRALLGETLVRIGAVDAETMKSELEIYAREKAGLVGLFLVNRGVTTLDAILDALERQRIHQNPIGRMALLEGALTAEQVMSVLETQVERNQKFGQVAIDLGFMTDAQMMQVLVDQAETRPRLAELLGEANRLVPEITAQISGILAATPA
ncbi:MAG: hypothetical protein H6729_00550 [Deltaproteobacteria bacterium]|nr:hypothetical protein [Deltaproteobacteria bacterium]